MKTLLAFAALLVGFAFQATSASAQVVLYGPPAPVVGVVDYGFAPLPPPPAAVVSYYHAPLVSYYHAPVVVRPRVVPAPVIVRPRVYVRPKVYIRGQPVRNTLRAITW